MELFSMNADKFARSLDGADTANDDSSTMRKRLFRQKSIEKTTREHDRNNGTARGGYIFYDDAATVRHFFIVS